MSRLHDGNGILGGDHVESEMSQEPDRAALPLGRQGGPNLRWGDDGTGCRGRVHEVDLQSGRLGDRWCLPVTIIARQAGGTTKRLRERVPDFLAEDREEPG